MNYKIGNLDIAWPVEYFLLFLFYRYHNIASLQESAPEIIELGEKFDSQSLNQASDIWSLGCVILQFLLDARTWNIENFMKQFGLLDESLALKQVNPTYILT